MKNILKITLILFMALLVSTPDMSAQRKSEKKGDRGKSSKYENYIEPGVVIIKVTERENGMWGINIDAGVDKNGDKRSLASNEREEESLSRLISTASLPELLNVLFKRGYKLNSAYAVPGKELTHYYVLSKTDYEDLQFDDRKKRTNQNRPQMSPGEIEKRRKMRENRDR